MFGTVSQWFFNWLGGIQPEPGAVGFDRIAIRPQLIKDLDWVRCTYDSILGPVTCNWKRRDNQVSLTVQVPVNATANIYLPIDSPAGVLEGGQPADQSSGIDYLRTERRNVVYRIGSGRYSFVIPYRD